MSPLRVLYLSVCLLLGLCAPTLAQDPQDLANVLDNGEGVVTTSVGGFSSYAVEGDLSSQESSLGLGAVSGYETESSWWTATASAAATLAPLRVISETVQNTPKSPSPTAVIVIGAVAVVGALSQDPSPQIDPPTEDQLKQRRFEFAMQYEQSRGGATLSPLWPNTEPTVPPVWRPDTEPGDPFWIPIELPKPANRPPGEPTREIPGAPVPGIKPLRPAAEIVISQSFPCVSVMCKQEATESAPEEHPPPFRDPGYPDTIRRVDPPSPGPPQAPREPEPKIGPDGRPLHPEPFRDPGYPPTIRRPDSSNCITGLWLISGCDGQYGDDLTGTGIGDTLAPWVGDDPAGLMFSASSPEPPAVTEPSTGSEESPVGPTIDTEKANRAADEAVRDLAKATEPAELKLIADAAAQYAAALFERGRLLAGTDHAASQGYLEAAVRFEGVAKEAAKRSSTATTSRGEVSEPSAPSAGTWREAEASVLDKDVTDPYVASWLASQRRAEAAGKILKQKPQESELSLHRRLSDVTKAEQDPAMLDEIARLAKARAAALKGQAEELQAAASRASSKERPGIEKEAAAILASSHRWDDTATIAEKKRDVTAQARKWVEDGNKGQSVTPFTELPIPVQYAVIPLLLE